jgi:hypothetical protein
LLRGVEAAATTVFNLLKFPLRSSQDDGNFCVRSSVTGISVYCNMVSAEGGYFNYYALLSDAGSFCVHKGEYGSADQTTLWCAGQKTRQEPNNDVALTSVRAYPDDCTLARWQQTGQDLNSVIADPRFTNADNGDFSLLPDSPALKLGFQPIDTSTVGPRPAKM